MNEAKRTQEPLFPSGTPVPSDTPLPISEEIKVDDSQGFEERAVYDGDISDSILAKLSAYYNEYSDGDDYAIYRADSNNYYLCFGDYSNNRFNNATLVRYQVVSSGYVNNGVYVTVTENTIVNPDLTGYTGYVYSSLDGYLPSRYIDSSIDRLHSRMDMVTSVIIVLCFLVAVIGIWFKRIRGRWL